MAQSSSSSSSSGVGFTGLLTVAFIVLKLIGKIDWSWWWVLSPVWISAILVVTLIVVFAAWELWPRKSKKYQLPKTEEKKSKFMEKLEEAMKESESKRNQN